jgi:hypothetical protein
MMIADTGTGTFPTRSPGAIGCRAIWQWTHSIGSVAVNGSEPVSIW